MIQTLCQRLFRDFDERHYLEQMMIRMNMFSILYIIPLVAIGLVWLVVETDLDAIRDHLGLLLLLLALEFAAEQFEFYVLTTVGNVRGTGRFTGSLAFIVRWAGVFILGPIALWLTLITLGISVFRRQNQWRRTLVSRVSQSRETLNFVSENTFIALTALLVYEQLDGTFPLADFSGPVMVAAFATIGVRFILEIVQDLPYIFYAARTVNREMGTHPREVIDLMVFASLISLIMEPFPILTAGIYTQAGETAFLFLMAGILLVGALAKQLSQAVERSQLRTLELDQLEQLGRAIIEGPPDASTLPELLQLYVPDMFTQSGITIIVFPDKTLLHYPETHDHNEDFWRWMRTTSSEGYVLPGQIMPWSREQKSDSPIVYAPILATASGRSIGGVYLESGHPDQKGIVHWLPAVQSLAAQVASALHSAEVYQRTLEHEKAAQELAVAGRIQNSFLPNSVPDVQGWQLVADLAPARDASGDFYDFIPLADNRLGILVADVADKGVGAALFMALSRTLIRTYAMQHQDRPEAALQAANERILFDTQSDLFVTVFYGVLDLDKGSLIYCNAGHNPGYLCYSANGQEVDTLGNTGIPLGMFDGFTWRSNRVTFEEGAVLLLYSDGLTEAHNDQEELFGDERLLSLVKANKNLSVHKLHQHIIESVQAFVGEMPQFDDITLMMIQRQSID